MGRVVLILLGLAALGALIVWLALPSGVVTAPETDRGEGPSRILMLQDVLHETLGIGAPTHGDLHLRVIDGKSRTPVAGARVGLFQDEDWSEPIASGLTDGHGDICFRDIPHEHDHVTRIEAEGYALACEDVWAVARDAEPRLVELRRPRPAHGEVRDAISGAPVAGARIVTRGGPCFIISGVRTLLLGPPLHATVSKADGGWNVPDLGNFSFLSVRAPGYAPNQRFIGRGESDEALRILLVPSGRLSGRVTGPDGSPVPGARVTACPHHSRSLDLLPNAVSLHHELDYFADRQVTQDAFEPIPPAITGPDGRYHFEGLAAGEPHEIRATADGFAASLTREGVSVIPGKATTLDLSLHRAAGLAFRVIWSSGRPVSEAGLGLAPRFTGAEESTFWGEERGIIRAEHLVPGIYEARVWASDCVREFEITLVGGETLRRDVDLGPGGGDDPGEIETVSGRVVNESGRPVVGARVECENAEPASLVTGADGAFSFKTPRRDHGGVSASADEHEWAGTSNDGTSTEIVLARTTRIPVVLPLEFPDGFTIPETVMVTAYRDRSGMPLVRQVRPAPDGLHLDLTPGPQKLLILIPGLLPFERDVKLEPSDDPTLAPARFRRGASLVVEVTDDLRQPLEGARVTFGQDGRGFSYDLGSATVRTDADGRAVHESLDPDRQVMITAQSVGHAHARVTSTPGERTEPVVFALTRQARFRGIVTDDRGYPVAFADIRVERLEGDGRADRDVADQAGRFSMWVTPGRIRVRVSAPEVDNEKSVPVDIRLDLDPDRVHTFVVPRR